MFRKTVSAILFAVSLLFANVGHSQQTPIDRFDWWVSMAEATMLLTDILGNGSDTYLYQRELVVQSVALELYPPPSLIVGNVMRHNSYFSQKVELSITTTNKLIYWAYAGGVGYESLQQAEQEATAAIAACEQARATLASMDQSDTEACEQYVDIAVEAFMKADAYESVMASKLDDYEPVWLAWGGLESAVRFWHGQGGPVGGD